MALSVSCQHHYFCFCFIGEKKINFLFKYLVHFLLPLITAIFFIWILCFFFFFFFFLFFPHKKFLTFFFSFSLSGGEVRQIEKEIKKCFIEAYKRTDADYLKVAAKKWVAMFKKIFATSKIGSNTMCLIIARVSQKFCNIFMHTIL